MYNYCFSPRHCSGFSIIEVMVAVVIASFISLGLMQVVLSLHKTAANVDVNASFAGVIGDMEMIMSNSDFCGSAFRDTNQSSPLKFEPPADPTSAYEKDIPYIMVDDNIVVQQDGANAPTPSSYKKDFKITKLKLSRVTSVPPQLTSYMDDSGSTVAGIRHIAKVELEAERKRGTLSGKAIKKSWLIELTTQQSNNRITKCANKDTPTILRAIAGRAGLTFSRIGCTEPIPSDRYLPNTCTDNNDDNQCDGEEWLATVEHPARGDNFWNNSFPNRQSGSPPVGTIAEEGRCLVSIENNTSSENPNEIFHLYNHIGSVKSSGIGCRVDNGWYLTGCFRNDNGTSDSDINIKKTSTAEYCVTNDYSQPHFGIGRAFSVLSVKMTIICMKLE